MHSPKLIKQIFDTLIKQGFSVSYNKNSSKLTLKGKRQLIKWMNEIGSSNNKHLHKINEFIGSSNSVG
jgi:predicted transcriptional regulator